MARTAYIEPASAQIPAEIPNVTVLMSATLMPMTCAATSLSRVATMARPTRLLTRLRAMT